jgi:hypothetical protein
MPDSVRAGLLAAIFLVGGAWLAAAPAAARLRHRPRAAPARIAARQPDLPARPTGPVLFVISVAGQHLTVYDNGVPVLRTPVATGVPNRPTPLGMFSIIQKQRFHRSNLYDDAPMPFMQRITWSGVALHAGYVPGGRPASHGCIRMPPAVATRLYKYTRLGMQVVIADHDLQPVEVPDTGLLAALERREAPSADRAQPALHPVQLASAAAPVEVRPAPVPSGGQAPAPADAPPAAPAAAPAATPADMPAAEAPVIEPPPPPTPSRSGHIAIFVSGKEGKIFIRQDFLPVYEAPVTIEASDRPLGNHLYLAMAAADGGKALRWEAVSLSGTPAPPVHHRRGVEPPVPPPPPPPVPTLSAAEALGRIALAPEVRDIVAPFVRPGTSLTVSDQGLGRETGRGTDFIVLTR